jgi:hypothetical protein
VKGSRLQASGFRVQASGFRKGPREELFTAEHAEGAEDNQDVLCVFRVVSGEKTFAFLKPEA